MFEHTPLVMVEDDATLRRVAAALAHAPAIGVDTEGDSFFSYQEKVCLLQISDLDRDYVIDPLAVEDLSPLAEIMADPDIVKVFHGADYDVVCLKRDFDFEIRGIFDTMLASQLVGLPRVGLADIIGLFFGAELEKKYQRHDWSRRPLLPEHVEYARGDSHWLPALREILTRRLERVGRMRHLEEECLLLEEREWVGRSFDPDGFLQVKGLKGLDDVGMRVLKRLYAYRDDQARGMNRPTFKVIADEDLVSVARRRPKDLDALDAALPGRAGLKRRHAKGLLECVVAGEADKYAIPKARPTARQERQAGRPGGRLKGKVADRVFESLKQWRNDTLDADPDLPAAAIASNSTLKEIARARPTSLEELREVEGVREWQVEDFGERLLALLDELAPIEPAKR